MKKLFLLAVIILNSAFVVLCLSRPVHAGDLDDSISSYTADPISKDDTLGKPPKNTAYIVQHAKSEANVMENALNHGRNINGIVSTSSSGANQANMDSVNVGPGSNVRGDIIILDQSKGPKVQSVGK